MKIAVFHNLRSSGGAKRALVEMCRELKSRGHTLDAFLPATAEENYLPLTEVVDSVRIFPVAPWALRQGSNPLEAVARIPEFFRTLRTAKATERDIAAAIDVGSYDLAFVHHGRYTQAPWVLTFLGTPSVYFCQEPIRDAYEYEHRPSMRGRLRLWAPGLGWAQIDRRNVTGASIVLSNSYYSRESILRAYGRDSAVIYLGVDAEQFTPGPTDRSRMVLSVGALHPRKGHALVLEAVARIPASRRPRVVVVADRALPSESAVLSALAGDLHVDLTLHVGASETELRSAYQNSMLLLCAAQLEPFGLVTLEAAASGTPVVAVNEAGLRETVAHGVTGILVERRDPGLMARAADALMSDSSRWLDFSRASVEWARSGWTWQRTGDRLEAVFAQLPSSQANPTGSGMS